MMSRQIDSNSLSILLLAKLQEQAERLYHLVGRLPAGSEDWLPNFPDALSTGELLGHLLDCLAGFCATLHALSPERLAHFAALRRLPVNHRCGISEALQRIPQYLAHIEEGFRLVADDMLSRRLPTVFVPEGEPVLTLLLGNLEHLINHKHQLFLYLKMQGIPVGTADLYQTRGA